MSLSGRVLLGGFVSIALVALCMGVAGYFALTASSDRYSDLSVSSQDLLLRKTTTVIGNSMKSELPKLARNKELTGALQKKKWDKVPEAAVTNYNALTTGGIVDHMRVVSNDMTILFAGDDDSILGKKSTMRVLAAAMEQGRIVAGYDQNDSGQLVISVASALTKRGKTVGMVVFERDISAALMQFREDTGIESVFLSAEGSLETETTPDLWSQISTGIGDVKIAGQQVMGVGDTSYEVTYRPVALIDGTAGGTWISFRDVTAAHAEEVTLTQIISGSLVLVLLAFTISFYMYLRRSLKPLKHIVHVINRVIEGERDIEIPVAKSKDEIGAITDAVSHLRDSLAHADELEKENAERERRAKAERELQREKEEEKRLAEEAADRMENEENERKLKFLTKTTSEFEDQIGSIVNVVSGAINQLQTSSSSMASVAERTSDRTQTVATASEEASTNVQIVSTAAEELSASISEISKQVSDSSVISSEAVEEAHRSHESVKGLVTSVNQINEVIELINDIAEQTNLLALNATIEAARAGDAGKGFSVVASEVKNLANQTAKATEQISVQISEIQTSTDQAAGSIEGIGSTIGRIDEIAVAISAAVEEQSAATTEIARNIEQASQGTKQVSGNIDQVRQGARETGTAAGEINGSTNELSEQSETLKAVVDEFLIKIRDAG